MNIVVCIKRVPATDSRIKIGADGTSIDPAQIEWIISPYDEFAVEAALQMKEAAGGGEVTVLTLGPAEATKELRTCLAMGADKAVLLKDADASGRDATSTAAALVFRENVQWSLRPEDLGGRVAKRIALSEMERFEEGFRFDAGELPLGDYEVFLDGAPWTTTLRLGPEGATDLRFEVDPLGVAYVRLDDTRARLAELMRSHR